MPGTAARNGRSTRPARPRLVAAVRSGAFVGCVHHRRRADERERPTRGRRGERDMADKTAFMRGHMMPMDVEGGRATGPSRGTAAPRRVRPISPRPPRLRAPAYARRPQPDDRTDILSRARCRSRSAGPVHFLTTDLPATSPPSAIPAPRSHLPWGDDRDGQARSRVQAAPTRRLRPTKRRPGRRKKRRELSDQSGRGRPATGLVSPRSCTNPPCAWTSTSDQKNSP